MTQVLRLLVALGACWPSLLWACQGDCGGTWAVLSPRGPIAAQEKDLILTALGLMLLVVVPVILMTFYIAWKYRASNPEADYAPDWDHSRRIEWVIWMVPSAIIALLGTLVWTSSHALSPYRALASPQTPLKIQVVALDWKWLFIYPDQRIATLNQLVIPSATPVSFTITSDAVMSSFFIPQLGGQIYAMAGMTTHLHLMADAPGLFQGYNTQFSGPGFSAMHFETRAIHPQDFARWVDTTRASASALDDARLHDLEKPSTGELPRGFVLTNPRLFEQIVDSYRTTPYKD